jgi:hypothetical protein
MKAKHTFFHEHPRARRVLIKLDSLGAGDVVTGKISAARQRKRQAVMDDTQRQGLAPYAGAAASGAVSGGALGALPLLKRGTSIATGLKSIGTGAAAAAALVGGGAYVGSKILGPVKDDEGAGFTKRAALGGTLAGAAAGGAGVLAARLVKRKLPIIGSPAAGLAKAAEEWRPAAAIAKSPLPVAVAGGAVAGGVLGGSHAADEGQQVDSIRNLRRDQQRRPARQALFAARQKLIQLSK